MNEQFQPTLFESPDTASGFLELFPAVWTAMEGLIAPEIERRRSAVERLEQMGALRFSPLVVYVMCTRLEEPDIPLRTRIIQLLGGLLTGEGAAQLATSAVQQQLTSYLAQARTRTVYCMLQSTAYDARLENLLARLLNACPYAGSHLTDILANRKNPLAIRKQAAHYIGVVGYLDAIPALERIASRLETHLKGQEAMPFVSASQPPEREEELLPYIYSSLLLLKVP